MKRIAIAAAALAMAGCGQTAEEDVEAAATEETAEASVAAITPGLYAVGDETTEYGRSQLNADGTYVDMNGEEVVGTGTWSAEGATMCFDPEGDDLGQQERCWTNAPPDADGSFMTTRDDGSESYRVTPITG
ncbi:hypothetical protein [Aurantiacibacter gilvus]|uniref:Uncharacterized protein n=1 Tax=Aurantiacibacter gilvus TaxID=3139141 RepID=A0ABU9IF61_9SPHN